MATRWKIPFRSLRSETLYTLNILDDTFSGTPVQLIGAGEPLVISEDNEYDFFIPVRTSSGSLTIVDTGKDADDNNFDWHEIMPADDTSRPVTLTDGNNIVWMGFIQADGYTSYLYEMPTERQFNLMCPLMALKAFTIDAETGASSFAYLLHKIFSKIPSLRIDYVDFYGTDSYDWLCKKFQWKNITENGEVSKNCLELLEDVCKFFGWTCKMSGTTIYFTADDEELSRSWISFRTNDLADIYNAQYREYSPGSVNISGNESATTNQQEEWVRGINEATVNIDVNPVENVFEFPWNEVYDKHKGGTVTDFLYGENGHWFTLSKFDGMGHRYELEDTLLVFRGGTLNLGAAVLIEDYYEGDISKKHRYDWRTGFEIHGTLEGTVYASESLIHFETLTSFFFEQGVLYLDGNCSQVVITSGSKTTFPGNGTMTCRMAIGDKWWNGSFWQYTKCSFNVSTGDENGGDSGAGMIISNRQLNSPWADYDGYGVLIAHPMSGVFQFEVVGISLDDNHGFTDSLSFSSFNVGFAREQTYKEITDQFTESSGANFREDRSLDLVFCCADKYQFGTAFILNPDLSYCESLHYNNLTERPELHLAKRMATFGSKVRKMLLLELQANLLPSLEPYKKIVFGGVWYSILSRKYNFRDDVVDLYVIEL